MTRDLPVISGKKVIKIFIKIGYVQTRQRGSHVRLKHPRNKNRRPLTVPLHKELKQGLLKSLLYDANLSIEVLKSMLTK